MATYLGDQFATPGAGNLAVPSGIITFWTTLTGVMSTVFSGATGGAVVPEPLSANMIAEFDTNFDEEKSAEDCAEAIAGVIDAWSKTNITGIFPGPVTVTLV